MSTTGASFAHVLPTTVCRARSSRADATPPLPQAAATGSRSVPAVPSSETQLTRSRCTARTTLLLPPLRPSSSGWSTTGVTGRREACGFGPARSSLGSPRTTPTQPSADTQTHPETPPRSPPSVHCQMRGQARPGCRGTAWVHPSLAYRWCRGACSDPSQDAFSPPPTGPTADRASECRRGTEPPRHTKHRQVTRPACTGWLRSRPAPSCGAAQWPHGRVCVRRQATCTVRRRSDSRRARGCRRRWRRASCRRRRRGGGGVVLRS
jgi:hypothetical protein